MKHPPPTILLFLKAPVAGRVKTRLADAIGANAALKVYRNLVASQMKRLPPDWKREIHYTPAPELAAMRDWLGDREDFHPQVEGDLGARLEEGITGAFIRGARAVCAIGGDCPGLGNAHFKEAESALASGNADVVFGPADDGGYYLVAMAKPIPSIFRNIPWSSPDTLQASINAARQQKLRIYLLPNLADLDTIEDYEKHHFLLNGSPSFANTR